MCLIKEHRSILRGINNIIKASESLDHPKFREIYFIESSYKNNQSKEHREYLLTRRGFSLVAVRYKCDKAMDFKLRLTITVIWGVVLLVSNIRKLMGDQ